MEDEEDTVTTDSSWDDETRAKEAKIGYNMIKRAHKRCKARNFRSDVEMLSASSENSQIASLQNRESSSSEVLEDNQSPPCSANKKRRKRRSRAEAPLVKQSSSSEDASETVSSCYKFSVHNGA